MVGFCEHNLSSKWAGISAFQRWPYTAEFGSASQFPIEMFYWLSMYYSYILQSGDKSNPHFINILTESRITMQCLLFLGYLIWCIVLYCYNFNLHASFLSVYFFSKSFLYNEFSCNVSRINESFAYLNNTLLRLVYQQ
jgi:hypothetical protein